jgi:hypothetical protein
VWRGYLAPYCAAPEYDAHRVAILQALCGPDPRFIFEAPDLGYAEGRAVYVVTWRQQVEVPPVVRAYNVQWAAVLHVDADAAGAHTNSSPTLRHMSDRCSTVR